MNAILRLTFPYAMAIGALSSVPVSEAAASVFIQYECADDEQEKLFVIIAGFGRHASIREPERGFEIARFKRVPGRGELVMGTAFGTYAQEWDQLAMVGDKAVMIHDRTTYFCRLIGMRPGWLAPLDGKSGADRQRDP